MSSTSTLAIRSFALADGVMPNSFDNDNTLLVKSFCNLSWNSSFSGSCDTTCKRSSWAEKIASMFVSHLSAMPSFFISCAVFLYIFLELALSHVGALFSSLLPTGFGRLSLLISESGDGIGPGICIYRYALSSPNQ